MVFFCYIVTNIVSTCLMRSSLSLSLITGDLSSFFLKWKADFDRLFAKGSLFSSESVEGRSKDTWLITSVYWAVFFWVLSSSYSTRALQVAHQILLAVCRGLLKLVFKEKKIKTNHLKTTLGRIVRRSGVVKLESPGAENLTNVAGGIQW